MIESTKGNEPLVFDCPICGEGMTSFFGMGAHVYRHSKEKKVK